MAGEAEDRSGGEGGGPEASRRSIPIVSDAPPPDELALPRQSPLFHALQADRYERQELIKYYEQWHGCRLVVMNDAIFPVGVTLFEELIFDASPEQPLHLLLNSPGGDGETAVRLIRAAQSRCSEFVVIVPDMAKSAATLLAMGAHQILMGPTSDLGPIDPQFQIEGQSGLISAKNIIAAVEAAEQAVAERPETYPLHASLLSNVTALMVQEARSALDRTDQIAKEALGSNRDRSGDEVDDMWARLKGPLAEEPANHSAVFDCAAAISAGLPVVELRPDSQHWQFIWRLWVKYAALEARVYEGAYASHVLR